ncbi:MAG: ABC transporter substrate-binding protein [Nocardioidaceae bacterium]
MRFASTPDCPPFDVDAAKAELSSSAFPDGFDVELTIDNLPESSTVAQIVQAQLEAIGITVKIKVIDSGELYTVYGQEGYQMGLAAWASDIPDPDEQLSYMLDPGAGGNAYYTGYDNPEVTDLIAQGRTTLDPDARAEAYGQVQEIVAQEVPQLPISYRDNAYVWRREVQGFTVNPMGVINLATVGMQQ